MPLTHVLFAALLAAPVALMAPSGLALASDNLDSAPDLKAGGVMFRQCALCHGQHGQGILGGKYPRIASMPEYYLMNALRDYQSGERGYDAMIVVGGLQVAEETDLMNLAAYIADLELTLDVPAPAEGSARSGKRMYNSDCRTCHGRQGQGQSRKESPPLRSQYTEYLLRQIAMFKRGERIHGDDPDDKTFVDYDDDDLNDILAFIASLDDVASADDDDDDDDDDDN